MKNQKLVESINNVGDKYLEEAIHYQGKKRVTFGRLPLLAVAAAGVLLVLGTGTYQYQYHYSVDSVVDIDVNPSIELTVSKAQKVLSVTALNEDARIVLDGMSLKNVDLDVAMNAIIGSLLKNGYLDEVCNAINVCVENDDEEAGEALGQKLKEEITLLLDENELLGKVQTQTTVANKDATKEAETYGVSAGKLALAKQVSECTGTELEEAVELSITELWDLSDAESTELITKEAALEIACADAGIAVETVVLLKNVIEETEGTFIYRIEFVVEGNGVYKYKVDAVEGTILESTYEQQEEDEEEIESSDDSEVELLTKKEILQIAYADAGVTEENVKLHELRLQKGDVAAYYVEFAVGKTDYEYLIHATDGTILSKEVEEWSATEPESGPEEMPIVKPSTEPEELPGERPSREPGERPEIESGEKPEDKPSDEQGRFPGERPGRFPGQKPEGETEAVEEEETQEESAQETVTEEETEEFPMNQPGGESDRFPNDKPNGQWECIPNEKPGNINQPNRNDRNSNKNNNQQNHQMNGQQGSGQQGKGQMNHR
ncbi:MAG: hypothetical protein E7290_06150 [Lachnospiraceae bacterium]|nr:hypothetical protein [Lachnospiraceae bacterium]